MTFHNFSDAKNSKKVSVVSKSEFGYGLEELSPSKAKQPITSLYFISERGYSYLSP